MNKSRNKRPYYHLILLTLGISLIASCGSKPSKKPSVRTKREITLQQTVINYLALSGFANRDFAAQVLGEEVICEKYNHRYKLLYFSAENNDSLAHIAANISSDTSVIRYGAINRRANKVYLDNVSIKDTQRMIFSIPADSLIFDSTRIITQKFGSVTYQLSLFDLREFLAANNLYNGPALAVTDTAASGALKVMANHAAPIAKAGEPTLNDLIAQITDSTHSQEKQAQRLLDFVTMEIAYKSHGKFEIFMKPHETILSRETDCSGKVVLYSSLLTQLDIPHILVYTPGHICVGVMGDFRKDNRMYFDHETGRYFLAETTVEGFQIGETRLVNPIREEVFEYLQFPGKNTKIYDLVMFDSLEFAVMEIEVP